MIGVRATAGELIDGYVSFFCFEDVDFDISSTIKLCEGEDVMLPCLSNNGDDSIENYSFVSLESSNLDNSYPSSNVAIQVKENLSEKIEIVDGNTI